MSAATAAAATPEQCTPTSGTEGKDHVSGLDSIRGLCAIWVVFSHLGFVPELATLFEPQSVGGKVLRGLLGNLFSGTPAVMVFFVVSGFCIHYPHCDGRTAPGLAFLVRRIVRIGMPFGAAFFLLRWTVPNSDGLALVQWSLIAELVYYLLYPLFFRLRKLAGWNAWVGLAVCIAVGIIASQPTARFMWNFGSELTWAVGLPHWLLGCSLAETVRSGSEAKVSIGKIWTLRLAVWAAASAASVLQFHLALGYPWTMLAFTPLAVVWVSREIQWQAVHPPLRLLAWLGAWSYSIYLLHLSAPDLLRSLGVSVASDRGTLRWVGCVMGALAICYLFYLAAERPSHQLARWVGRRLVGRKVAHARAQDDQPDRRDR